LSKKEKNSTTDIVNNFLAKLGVAAEAKTFEVEEYLKIEIDGPDAPLLIGFHGDNLRSLRHLLSIILRKELGPDTIVTVDVAGYLARKEEKIKEIAQRAAEKFDKTKIPQDLPQMSSFERRIAHSYLTEKGYVSESLGEGYDRHIVVSK
jgi:spoIIIJ-associated protein